MEQRQQRGVFREMFQCSSASRKFLNVEFWSLDNENAGVSVLFSEPKIPQLRAPVADEYKAEVSVLFSEPKIPQSAPTVRRCPTPCLFQCSSASRKFLNRIDVVAHEISRYVSVLFSEPKIPQLFCRSVVAALTAMRFSALQRAENSSITGTTP